MTNVIEVTRKQVKAAKDAIRLSKITGHPVPPAVIKIANAKPTANSKPA
jgi:hypothetical protein